MIRFPTFLTLLLVVVFGAATAIAAAPVEEDPWYEIEVIVFENVGAQSGPESSEFETPAPLEGVELIPAVPPAPGIADPDPIAAEAPGATAFHMLEDSELRLRGALQRLKATPRYRPLLHTGWRQPVTATAGFPGVRLSTAPAADSASNAQAGDQAAPGHAPNGDAAAAVQGLEGLVRLSRGRFLNLGVDLRLRQPGEPPRGFFNRQAAPDRIYRLQQARRVRSGELQYFDHPRFGAIVLITPYETTTVRAIGLVQP